MTTEAPEAPQPPPVREPVDITAPYGRFKNGTPRKAPVGSSKRTAKAPSAAKRPTSITDYRPGLLGLAQLGAMALSFKAPADAAAITYHAPPIAEALNDLAAERPEVAAVLDKILAAGPYGALIAAVLPLGLQLAHNHGLLGDGAIVQAGGMPKAEILRQLREQAGRQEDEHATAAA